MDPKNAYIAIVLSLIGFFLFSVSGKDLPAHYLSVASNGKLTIEICPAKLSSRAGTIFTTRKNQTITVDQYNASITVSFTVAKKEVGDCYNNETLTALRDVQFGLYLSFRAFFMELSPQSHPVFVAKLITNHNTGTAAMLNLTAIPTFSPQNYPYYPRSDVQYFTNLQRNLDELEIDLELHKQLFDSVSESVIIDYALVSSEQQNSDSLTYCPTLRGTLPKEVYCVDKSYGALICPSNCTKITAPLLTSGIFDGSGFSYGSCGLDRSSSICGDDTPYAASSARYDWRLPTSTLIGVIACGVLIFILGPLAFMCLVWYRRQH